MIALRQGAPKKKKPHHFLYLKRPQRSSVSGTLRGYFEHENELDTPWCQSCSEMTKKRLCCSVRSAQESASESECVYVCERERE